MRSSTVKHSSSKTFHSESKTTTSYHKSSTVTTHYSKKVTTSSALHRGSDASLRLDIQSSRYGTGVGIGKTASIRGRGYFLTEVDDSSTITTGRLGRLTERPGNSKVTFGNSQVT